MRLLLVDLRRIAARRAVRVTFLVGMLICVIAGGAVFLDHEDTVPDRQAAYEEFVQRLEKEEQHCLELAEPEEDVFCELGEPPRIDDVPIDDQRAQAHEIWRSDVETVYSQTGETQESFSADHGALPATAPLIALVGALIGATFVGAEWRAGTVETALLWDPRRGRLTATRYLAAAIGGATLAMSLGFMLTVAFLPSLQWRGTTAGLTGDFWIGAALTICRWGVLGGLFAMLGAGLADLTRHTAGAIGIVMGLVLGGEFVGNSFAKGLLRWMPTRNVFAVAQWTKILALERVTELEGGPSYWTDAHFGGPLVALGWLAVIVLVAVALGALRMIRSDVT